MCSKIQGSGVQEEHLQLHMLYSFINYKQNKFVLLYGLITEVLISP